MSNMTSNKPHREDYQKAMQSMDTYIDITIDDLIEVNKRAEFIARQRLDNVKSVRSIMSNPVVTVFPETTLSEAAHYLVKERISGLPVVDEKGWLIGIITEADFLRSLGFSSPRHKNQTIWETLEHLFEQLAHHGEMQNNTEGRVRDFMSNNVVCIGEDESLHAAISKMKTNEVKRLVVCDQQGKVIGMITRSDLVRVFFDKI